MTERLSALLHQEADVLRVPPPATERILAQGRGVRRRRRLANGAAGLALAGLVGTGIGLAVSGENDTSPHVADDGSVRTTGLRGANFTVGVTVFLDGGAVTATIDDQAVKSSYFTSAGLLVRHGDNNWSDGGGPQRFSLVTPDGTVKKLSVVTEETVPGVDPAQPYLAYTVVEDGVVQVIVHDVSTDQRVAKVAVPDVTEWGGWSGPPVGLNGDLVYVGGDDLTRTVNWRTGEIQGTDAVGPGYPDIAGGLSVVTQGRESAVVDIATGEVIYRVEKGFPRLSPDGRFLSIMTPSFDSFTVVDLATKEEASFEGSSFDYGWTPEGDLARLVDRHVETCSLDTGECSTADRTIPSDGGGNAPDDVRYAGNTYES
jgi:hypothetical protein